MSSESEGDKLWKIIDQQFEKTLKHAEQAYRTNYFINLIIVTVGIVMLGSSIYFAYIRGLDLSTLTYAGLGIADFVALFLFSPQTRIERLIGDLNQILVIFRTWKNQTTLMDCYAWDDQGGPKLTSCDQIKDANIEYGRISEEALNAIEKYVGVEPKAAEPKAAEPKAAEPIGQNQKP